MPRNPRHTKGNALAKGGVVPQLPEEVPSSNEESKELSRRSAEMTGTALVPPRKKGKKENAAPLLPEVLKASSRAASTPKASAAAPVFPACPAADAPAIASNEPRDPIPVPAGDIEVECPGDTPLESEAGSEAPASSMWRKRAPNRNKLFLSQGEQEMMADFLGENSGLNDRRRDIWRDPGAKDRLWEEQALKMNRTVAELKTWYDTMRTRLGRLKQGSQKSGSGAKEDVWSDNRLRWWEMFDFLRPRIIQCKALTVTPITSLVTTMLSPATFTRCSSTRTPRRQEQVVQLVEALVSAGHRQDKLRTLSEQLLSHLRPQGTLEEQQRQSFVNHVGTVLKSLPRDLYRQAQQQIWTVLNEIQDSADRRLDPQPPSAPQHRSFGRHQSPTHLEVSSLRGSNHRPANSRKRAGSHLLNSGRRILLQVHVGTP